MSLFVCGEFILGAPQSESWLQDYSRQLTRTAWERRLHVSLGGNIAQPRVLELLRRNGSYDECHLPFFLTGSPLASTSEDLIGTSATDGPHAIARLREGLEKISGFLRASWVREVHSTVMIFADAPTDSLMDGAATLNNFVEVMLSHFADYQRIPDMRLLVRKAA